MKLNNFSIKIFFSSLILSFFPSLFSLLAKAANFLKELEIMKFVSLVAELNSVSSMAHFGITPYFLTILANISHCPPS